MNSAFNGFFFEQSNTFDLFQYVVDSAYTTVIAGNTLRAFRATSIMDSLSNSWCMPYSPAKETVEKIGSTFLLAGNPCATILEYPGPLRCYQDSSMFAKFSPEPCDSIYGFVGMQELVNQGGIKIYPNPGSGIFTVKLQEQKAFDIHIFDTLGKRIFCDSEEQGSSKLVDLTMTGQGIYFIKIISKHSTETRKLIVE